MELQILYWIQEMHTSILNSAMVFITSFGNHGQFWIVLALLYLFFDRKDRKCGWHMGIALILSLLICNILLKNLVARDRPCWIDSSIPLLIHIPKDYSFPSGHSSASIAAALSLWIHHKKAGTFALAFALLIAFSRMYLFVHWPTDVLGGLIIGLICALLSGKILTMIENRQRRRKPTVGGNDI